MKLLILLLFPLASFSQIDSVFVKKIKSLDTANVLKTDTVAMAEDALTQKIRTLLAEKQGLTIQTIIRLKISEEQQKDTTHSKQFYTNLLDELTTGKTSKLLENSLINIYRRTFTETEVDELVRFYKTSAGQKMDREFLVLLVESAKVAEQLMKMAASKLEKGSK